MKKATAALLHLGQTGHARFAVQFRLFRICVFEAEGRHELLPILLVVKGQLLGNSLDGNGDSEPRLFWGDSRRKEKKN